MAIARKAIRVVLRALRLINLCKVSGYMRKDNVRDDREDSYKKIYLSRMHSGEKRVGTVNAAGGNKADQRTRHNGVVNK